MAVMTPLQRASTEFEAWYQALPVHAISGGPAKGTIGGALVVLERLKRDFSLEIASHTTSGGAQIRGAGGRAVQSILARFGEVRPFLSEGGRTNRGLRGDITALLQALKRADLRGLSEAERNVILTELQKSLVQKVADFHARQRLHFLYEPSRTAWELVHQILEAAREKGKEGPVAQYLVGAKLDLRFPDVGVRNQSYSTADQQLGVPADFQIGDTAFHVTVAAMQNLLDKCRANIDSGCRVYILVPERSVYPTRVAADAELPGRITVASIESFVAQNIEELAAFSQDSLAEGFYKLLETYNRRTDEVEIDKSVLIEVPANLLRYA